MLSMCFDIWDKIKLESKPPDTNAGQNQGDGLSLYPFEHCQKNVFHGKQDEACNNSKKGKQATRFFVLFNATHKSFILGEKATVAD